MQAAIAPARRQVGIGEQVDTLLPANPADVEDVEAARQASRATFCGIEARGVNTSLPPKQALGGYTEARKRRVAELLGDSTTAQLA
jgi:hypothetical protein